MTRRGPIAFFVPALGVFVLFFLLPATATLWESVHSFRGETPRFVGALYYRHALGDAAFQRALVNNLIYLGWTLCFEVAVGLFLAVALERENRLNRFLRVVFFAPNVLSLVVVGLVFGFLFKDEVGVFPGLLRSPRALLTISVISGWTYCGFYMVIFLAGLSQVPPEVLEAARLDGASPWQTFWRIKLPLLREVLYVALLICFTEAFKAFDLFWVLVSNQPETGSSPRCWSGRWFSSTTKGMGRPWRCC